MRLTSPGLFLTLGMLGLGLPPAAATASEPLAHNPKGCQQLPALIDLRPQLTEWGLGPRLQGGRPTCSVCTFTGALEFAVAHSRKHGERLSPEFLNWAANQTGRAARDGGFFTDMWDGFARHGICSEAKMPYLAKFDHARSPDPAGRADAKTILALGLQLHWIKKWNVTTGLSDDELAGIKNTLNQGWPVCGGFRWPKQAHWQNAVLQMCPAEDVFDGHSVLLVGYSDAADQPGGGTFVFRNSNGDGRDGSMPYAYARAYMNDAVWVESAVKPPATQP